MTHSPDTDLLRAATIGDARAATSALNSGAALDCVDEMGRTPLILGAHHGNSEIVDLVISRGGKLDIRDAQGRTAAMASALADRPSIVRVLAAAGANCNSKDSAGRRPIAVAAASASPACLRAFLDGNAALEIKDGKGRTALHSACAAGRADTAAILLAAGASVHVEDDEGQRPLALAAVGGFVEIVHMLLEAKADPDAQDQYGDNAWLLAVDHGREECAAALKAAPTKINSIPHGSSGDSFLIHAARWGNALRARALVRERADATKVDRDGRTALMVAAGAGHAACFQILMGCSDLAAVDKFGLGARDIAAQKERHAILALLGDIQSPAELKALAAAAARTSGSRDRLDDGRVKANSAKRVRF